MAIRGGITLFNSSFIGSSVGTAQQWMGGRSVIVINATQYGGGVFLQVQGPSGAWVPINASTYAADQVTAYDLPPGQYRIISNQGSSIGVAASLVGVSYGY